MTFGGLYRARIGHDLLFRRYPRGRAGSFWSVRDLGRFPARRSYESGKPQSRPAGWLPAWLPGRLTRRPDEGLQVSIVATSCTIGGGPAAGSAP